MPNDTAFQGTGFQANAFQGAFQTTPVTYFGGETVSKKTLIDFRADIRRDLADTATFFANAEIDRAVVRAVADLSRFLPRELYQEYTLDFSVADESVTSPATTSLTAVVNAQTINVAEGSLLTIAGQPDLPRPLILTLVDANSSTYRLAIIVTGKDRDNKAVQETFRWARGDSLTLTGKKEFKYVHEVELDVDAGSGAGDTASLGYGTTYTSWVYLDNKPIKDGSVVVKNAAGTTTYTLGTDYTVDYNNGAIKLVSGGAMAAATVYLVSYTKSKIAVDISELEDLISVLDVEYPYGDTPQTTVSHGLFGNILTVEGAEAESQDDMSDDDHIVMRYLATHSDPTDYFPSTFPAFLDNTVEQLAEAYLLYEMCQRYEQQAVTDLASVRTALGLESHTKAGTALDAANTTLDTIDALYTKIETALDAIATAAGTCNTLHTDIATANAAANTALDLVAALFTELETAMDAMVTAQGKVETYLTGASAPSTLKYLTDGDAFLNTVNVGANVPENHAAYALRSTEIANSLIAEANGYGLEATKRIDRIAQKIAEANGYISESAVRQTEIDRRIAEAGAYASEVNARVSEIDRKIAESDGYLREASTRLVEMDKYTADADRYSAVAQLNTALVATWRADATEKRNEVWSIWRDRKQYIGDVSSISLQQPRRE